MEHVPSHASFEYLCSSVSKALVACRSDVDAVVLDLREFPPAHAATFNGRSTWACASGRRVRYQRLPVRLASPWYARQRLDLSNLASGRKSFWRSQTLRRGSPWPMPAAMSTSTSAWLDVQEAIDAAEADTW